MAKVGTFYPVRDDDTHLMYIAGNSGYLDWHRTHSHSNSLHQLPAPASLSPFKNSLHTTSTYGRPSPTRPLYLFNGVFSLLVSSTREKHPDTDVERVVGSGGKGKQAQRLVSQHGLHGRRRTHGR